MSWRFRKTFKVLPGVKLNLTRHGLSATLGAAPFSVNVGPRGVYRNVSIPGTGLWNRERLDRPSRSPVVELPSRVTMTPEPRVEPILPTVPSHGPITEIRSTSTELLSSQNMEDLRKLLHEAYEERQGLTQEVASAEQEVEKAAHRYHPWERGFMFKRIFKGAFAARRTAYETAEAKRDELREQLRLTTLATQIDIDREQAEPYYKMRDDFAALSESAKIWDTLDRRPVDRARERSAASEAITREAVAFSLNSCDLIQWDRQVPHLPNRTGGDMYIYPGFLLYRASRQAFALIDSREAQVRYRPTRFIEDQPVPADTQIVGQAWAKSNKDGSPDRRFHGNYQIPIALYGTLTFTSVSGLHEEYQVSNCSLAERFADAWNRFQTSYEPRPLNEATVAGVMTTAGGDINLAADPMDAGIALAGESEKARTLASERGEYWEFLLTEELLRPKLAAVQRGYEAIDTTVIPSATRYFTGREFLSWLTERVQEPGPMVDRLRASVEQDLPSAWGKPGEPGDPAKILIAVTAIVDCCRELAKWELDIYLAAPPKQLKPLSKLVRGFWANVISEVNRVPDELTRVIEGARRGERNFRMHLTYAPSPQGEKFIAEIQRVVRKAEKSPQWLPS